MPLSLRSDSAGRRGFSEMSRGSKGFHGARQAWSMGLLAFAKMRGQAPEALDLNREVEEALALAERTSNGRVDIRRDYDKGFLCVMGDKGGTSSRRCSTSWLTH